MRFFTGVGRFGHGHTVHFNRAPRRRSVFSGVRTTAHAHVGRSAPRRRVYSTPRRQPSVRHGYHPKPSERTSYALSAPRRQAQRRFAQAYARAVAGRDISSPLTALGLVPGFNNARFGTTNPIGRLALGGPIQQSGVAALGALDTYPLRAGLGPSVKAQANALWGLVGKAYGGKKPKTRVHSSGPAGLAGWVSPLGSNKANFNLKNIPLAAQSAQAPASRATLQRLLLHEWAHTRQPRGYRADRTLIEGGAEAYARYIAQHYGLGGATEPWAYPRETAFVNQRLGPNWVRRRQFMRP